MNKLKKAFKLPKSVTIMGRSSSITNSFVNGIIPVKKPTDAEIKEALRLLEQDSDSVVCIYCGDKMTEWDHLHPLIRDKKSTGYITEIANLVPACGKCNQSKGNTDWREWITSDAKLSPKSRGVKDLTRRIEILESYQKHFNISRIEIEKMIGNDLWDAYWQSYDVIIASMRKAQELMDQIKPILNEDKKITRNKNRIATKEKTSLADDIKAIGMATFVKYFELFNDTSPNRQNIINKLTDNEAYKSSSINTKVSKGLKIIKNGNAIPALELISTSTHVDNTTRLHAQKILNRIRGF